MVWPMWVMILTAVMVHSATAATLHEMLTPKYSKMTTVLLFLPVGLLIRLFRAYTHINMPWIPSRMLVDALLLPILTFLFFRLVCKDKSLKIILFVILLRGLMLFSDILANYIYILTSGKYMLTFELSENQSVFVAFIPSLAITLSLILFMMIWKKYVGAIRVDIPNAGAFLLILFGYLFLAFFLSYHGDNLIVNPMWGSGLIVWIVSYGAVLQILFTNSKAKEAEENLKELTHIRELEQMHYNAIEARRQELLKIRHDFYNQLATMHQLIADSDKEAAEKLLGELERSLDGTVEYSFCQNAIVNAVLHGKQKECEAAGILLETSVVIEEGYRISPLHLCSIFTNLLDNAINGCKTVAEEQRKILLCTAVRGDYLHIKCVNPVSPDVGGQQVKRNRKGYGTIILSDIAGLYEGNFSGEKVDGEFVAMISLLLQEEAE